MLLITGANELSVWQPHTQIYTPFSGLHSPYDTVTESDIHAFTSRIYELL